MTELIWERPDYLLNGEIVYPHVYEGEGQIPVACDGVTIKLDGTAQADLSWKKEREKALELVDKGCHLFWEIDLGLFDRLTLPLDHQGQFLSLTLSLEYFRDTLWNEFKDKTIGLSIYRGDLDFSSRFCWDVQQTDNLNKWIKQFGDIADQQQIARLFCRDAAIEYLSLLATRLPDALACFLMLDAQSIDNPLHEAQLLNPERYDLLNVAIKNSNLPWDSWKWQENQLKKNHPSKAQVGVCFPPMEMFQVQNYAGLDKAFESLLKQKIPFRIIAENHLITGWDGLDYLIYVPAGLSPQGKRKLQGFCAAGGTCVTLGQPLGLANEISLADLLK